MAMGSNEIERLFESFKAIEPIRHDDWLYEAEMPEPFAEEPKPARETEFDLSRYGLGRIRVPLPEPDPSLRHQLPKLPTLSPYKLSEEEVRSWVSERAKYEPNAGGLQNALIAHLEAQREGEQRRWKGPRGEKLPETPEELSRQIGTFLFDTAARSSPEHLHGMDIDRLVAERFAPAIDYVARKHNLQLGEMKFSSKELRQRLRQLSLYGYRGRLFAQEVINTANTTARRRLAENAADLLREATDEARAAFWMGVQFGAESYYRKDDVAGELKELYIGPWEAISRSGYNLLWGRSDDQLSAQLKQAADYLYKSKSVEGLPWWGTFAWQSQQVLSDLIPITLAVYAGGAAGAAVGESLAGGGAALTVAKGAPLAVRAATTAGQFLGLRLTTGLVQQEDVARGLIAEGVDQRTAFWAGAAAATLDSVIELWLPLPGSERLAVAKTIKGAFLNGVKQFGVDFATESAEELLQGISQTIAEHFARRLSGVPDRGLATELYESVRDTTKVLPSLAFAILPTQVPRLVGDAALQRAVLKHRQAWQWFTDQSVMPTVEEVRAKGIPVENEAQVAELWQKRELIGHLINSPESFQNVAVPMKLDAPVEYRRNGKVEKHRLGDLAQQVWDSLPVPDRGWYAPTEYISKSWNDLPKDIQQRLAWVFFPALRGNADYMVMPGEEAAEAPAEAAPEAPQPPAPQQPQEVPQQPPTQPVPVEEQPPAQPVPVGEAPPQQPPAQPVEPITEEEAKGTQIDPDFVSPVQPPPAQPVEPQEQRWVLTAHGPFTQEQMNWFQEHQYSLRDVPALVELAKKTVVFQGPSLVSLYDYARQNLAAGVETGRIARNWVSKSPLRDLELPTVEAYVRAVQWDIDTKPWQEWKLSRYVAVQNVAGWAADVPVSGPHDNLFGLIRAVYEETPERFRTPESLVHNPQIVEVARTYPIPFKYLEPVVRASVAALEAKWAVAAGKPYRKEDFGEGGKAIKDLEDRLTEQAHDLIVPKEAVHSLLAMDMVFAILEESLPGFWKAVKEAVAEAPLDLSVQELAQHIQGRIAENNQLAPFFEGEPDLLERVARFAADVPLHLALSPEMRVRKPLWLEADQALTLLRTMLGSAAKANNPAFQPLSVRHESLTTLNRVIGAVRLSEPVKTATVLTTVLNSAYQDTKEAKKAVNAALSEMSPKDREALEPVRNVLVAAFPYLVKTQEPPKQTVFVEPLKTLPLENVSPALIQRELSYWAYWAGIMSEKPPAAPEAPPPAAPPSAPAPPAPPPTPPAAPEASAAPPAAPPQQSLTVPEPVSDPADMNSYTDPSSRRVRLPNGGKQLEVLDTIEQCQAVRGPAIVKTELLSIDPGKFQYKREANKVTGIVNTNVLDLSWNEALAGIIHVWFDPQSNKVYVINGHHRYQIALKSGVPHVTCYFLDAANEQEARQSGALVNIAEGHGDVMDAAVFLREMRRGNEDLRELLAKHNVSVKEEEKLAYLGLGLAMLAEPLWKRYVDGEISATLGGIVGNELSDDPELQKDAIHYGKQFRSEEEIRELCKLVRDTKTKHKERTLFGEVEIADSLLPWIIRVRSAVRKELNDRIKALRVASKEKLAEPLEQLGNVIFTDKNLSELQKLIGIREYFLQFQNYKGKVADAIKELAEQAEKTKRIDAKKAFETIQEAILQELDFQSGQATARLGELPKSPDGTLPSSNTLLSVNPGQLGPVFPNPIATYVQPASRQEFLKRIRLPEFRQAAKDCWEGRNGVWRLMRAIQEYTGAELLISRTQLSRVREGRKPAAGMYKPHLAISAGYEPDSIHEQVHALFEIMLSSLPYNAEVEVMSILAEHGPGVLDAINRKINDSEKIRLEAIAEVATAFITGRLRSKEFWKHAGNIIRRLQAVDHPYVKQMLDVMFDSWNIYHYLARLSNDTKMELVRKDERRPSDWRKAAWTALMNVVGRRVGYIYYLRRLKQVVYNSRRWASTEETARQLWKRVHAFIDSLHGTEADVKLTTQLTSYAPHMAGRWMVESGPIALYLPFLLSKKDAQFIKTGLRQLSHYQSQLEQWDAFIDAISDPKNRNMRIAFFPQSVRDVLDELVKQGGSEAVFWEYAQLRAILHRGDVWGQQTLTTEEDVDERQKVTKLIEDIENSPTGQAYKDAAAKMQTIFDRLLLLSVINGEKTAPEALAMMAAQFVYWPLRVDFDAPARNRAMGETPRSDIYYAQGGLGGRHESARAVETKMRRAVVAYYDQSHIKSVIRQLQAIKNNPEMPGELRTMVSGLMVKFYEDVKPASVRISKKRMAELIKEVTGREVDPDSLLLNEDFYTYEFFLSTRPKAPNIVEDYKNGVREYYFLPDPVMFHWLGSTNISEWPPWIRKVIRYAGKIVRPIELPYVRNIGFALTNMFRDEAFAAAMGTGIKDALVPFYYHLHGLAALITNKELADKLTFELLGTHGKAIGTWTSVAQLPELYVQRLKETATSGFEPLTSKELRWWEKAIALPAVFFVNARTKPVQLVIEATGQGLVAEGLESLPRLGAAKLAQEKGLTDAEVQMAASMITGNFSQRTKNQAVSDMMSMSMFVNPMVQIMWQILEAAALDPTPGRRATFWLRLPLFGLKGAMLAGTVALLGPVIYRLMGRDEDEWIKDEMERSAGDRARYVRLGPFRLPRPESVWGLVQHLVYNVTMDLIASRGPDWKVAAKTVVDELYDVVGRTMFKSEPWIWAELHQLASNWNFFKEKEIVGGLLRELYPNNPELQYWPDTPKTYRAMSRALSSVGIGISPLKIEHFVNAYLTRHTHDLIRFAEHMTGWHPTLREVADLPFIGRVMARTPRGYASRSVQDVRDLAADYRALVARMKAEVKEGNVPSQDANTFLEEASKLVIYDVMKFEIDKLGRESRELRLQGKIQEAAKIDEQMTLMAAAIFNSANKRLTVDVLRKLHKRLYQRASESLPAGSTEQERIQYNLKRQAARLGMRHIREEIKRLESNDDSSAKRPVSVGP